MSCSRQNNPLLQEKQEKQKTKLQQISLKNQQPKEILQKN